MAGRLVDDLQALGQLNCIAIGGVKIFLRLIGGFE